MPEYYIKCYTPGYDILGIWNGCHRTTKFSYEAPDGARYNVKIFGRNLAREVEILIPVNQES